MTVPKALKDDFLGVHTEATEPPGPGNYFSTLHTNDVITLKALQLTIVLFNASSAFVHVFRQQRRRRLQRQRRERRQVRRRRDGKVGVHFVKGLPWHHEKNPNVKVLTKKSPKLKTGP